MTPVYTEITLLLRTRVPETTSRMLLSLCDVNSRQMLRRRVQSSTHNLSLRRARTRTCEVHAVRSDQMERRPASNRHAQRRALVVRHTGVDETGARRQVDDDVRLGVERRHADRLLRRDAICRVPRQCVVVGAR